MPEPTPQNPSFDRDKPGDPECVCQGTGLTCTLLGLEPDPSSIAICDCILDKLEANHA